VSYQWFRMYAEFATDPVVQSLAFDDQRHFVMVLCLKCSGLLDREYGDPQQRVAMLRRALGLEAMAFDEAKTRLCSARLIDGDWQPVNWAKRQFVSDRDPTAADRKRRQRERHAHVTRDSTDESRIGHSPQNQNTESEKNKKAAIAAEVVLHESLPKEAWEEWLAHRREKRLTMSPRALNKQLKLLARYDTATQREMIDTSINAGWEGIFAPKGGKPQEEARRGLPVLRV